MGVWDKWDGWVRPIALGSIRSPLPSHHALLVLPGTPAPAGALGLAFLVPLPCVCVCGGREAYCFTDIHILTRLVLSTGLCDGRVWTPAQSLTMIGLSHAVQRLFGWSPRHP